MRGWEEDGGGLGLGLGFSDMHLSVCEPAVNMIYVRLSNETVFVALLCHTARVETSHSDSIQKT